MDEARQRAILGERLRGTPVEGDEREMDRLMALELIDRLRAVAIIAGGEADTVDGALEDYRWRSEFYRDVQGDIDNL